MTKLLTTRTMSKNHRYASAWWVVCLVAIVVLRLFLTSDRDILAINHPHDDYWYVHRAATGLFGGRYDQMALIHLPTYSAWLSLSNALGIPARFAIDLSWLLACGYLAYAMNRLTTRMWVAMLIFAFLAFHPYALFIFDRSLPETLLAVLSTAALGAGIDLWNLRGSESGLRRKVAIVVYVGAFALAFHTRAEGAVLMAPLFALGGWSLLERKRWWAGEGRRRLAIPLLIAPLLATSLLGILLAGVNYIRWGVFARYDLSAPGYQRAMAALISIDIGRTPKRFTVTRQALALAYRESPTFGGLRTFMDANPGQGWVAISRRFTGIPGEIGNGWFYWALRDAAARAGWHQSAQIADAKYAAVADELEQAFTAGRINRRQFVISSFVDPDLGKWMSDVPTSAFNVLQLVARPQPGYLAAPKENASATQYEVYVSVLGRRHSRPNWRISGWTIMRAGTLIGLGAGGLPVSWTLLSGQQRPDVRGAFPFTVTALDSDPPPQLQLQAPDGRIGSIALAALKQGHVSSTKGSIAALVGIDELHVAPRRGRADRWLVPLCSFYDWTGAVFVLLMIGGWMVALVAGRTLPLDVLLVLALAVVSVATRVALLGVLDASSWNGMQARYVLPVIPAFACAGMLGLSILNTFRLQRQQHDAPSQS